MTTFLAMRGTGITLCINHKSPIIIVGGEKGGA